MKQPVGERVAAKGDANRPANRHRHGEGGGDTGQGGGQMAKVVFHRDLDQKGAPDRQRPRQQIAGDERRDDRPQDNETRQRQDMNGRPAARVMIRHRGARAGEW